MRFSLLAMAIMATSIDTIAAKKVDASASTDITCVTKMGKKSKVAVPTVTKHHTGEYTVTAIETVRPGTTITPDTVTLHDKTTTTLTETETADAGTSIVEVDDYTTITTTTVFPETTITVTPTETDTTKFVTVPSLVPTTIATAAGYTPIQDTLPQATLKAISNVQAAKRAVAGSRLARGVSELSKRAKGLAGVGQFPKKVVCDATTLVPEIVTSTKTAKKTKTVTLATPITKVTDTSSETFTKTVFPDSVTVKTTNTVTLTNLVEQHPVSSVVVPTFTPTVTTIVNWPTVVAQCADAENYANYAFDKRTGVAGYIADASYGTVVSIVTNAANTPYDCCAACQATEGCLYGAFNKGLASGSKCSLAMDNASGCTASSPCTGNVKLSTTLNEGNSFIIFNGPAWKETGFY
jgi:hypothetical protein